MDFACLGITERMDPRLIMSGMTIKLDQEGSDSNSEFESDPLQTPLARLRGEILERRELFSGLADSPIGIISGQFINLLPEGSILSSSQNLHGANSGMRIC